VRTGRQLLAPRRLVAGISGAAAIVAIGCTQVLSADDYYVVPDRVDSSLSGVPAGDGGEEATQGVGTSDGGASRNGDSGGGDSAVAAETGCTDPSGPAGQSCYRCTPTTTSEFLNACTAARCTPFPDASRLSKLEPDGGLPALPLLAVGDAGAVDGSVSAAADAGSPSEAGSRDAGADDAGLVACSSLPNPIYATGSTAIAPFLGTIAQVVARPDAQGRSVTVVYQAQGSCLGVDAILNATPVTQTATYWDPNVANVSQAALTCALSPGGNVVDLGVSDVFATTCFDLPGDLPANIGDFFGPVQIMTFAVPEGSSEATISAAAAYLVYGFGAAGGVAPWTNETLIEQRSAASGTQNMIARAIGVPAALWHGETNATSQAVLNALLAAGMQGSSSASAAIGILGTDYADGARGQVRVLAFQAYGQQCAFYPDSTATSEDKANVRDGHYPIWGPLHLLARLTSQGVTTSATVGQIIDYLTGTAPLPGQGNLIQLYATNHLVPTCAMHVTRTTDGADISAYKSPQPCSCYYDTLVSGTTTCASCSGSNDCAPGTPNCSYGYCEP
jgi:hypothetical protein